LNVFDVFRAMRGGDLGARHKARAAGKVKGPTFGTTSRKALDFAEKKT
jgi:hypothetical protein